MAKMHTDEKGRITHGQSETAKRLRGDTHTHHHTHHHTKGEHFHVHHHKGSIPEGHVTDKPAHEAGPPKEGPHQTKFRRTGHGGQKLRMSSAARNQLAMERGEK